MGREHKAEVAFPASLLKPGNNRIEITTVSGSWILYDSLSLNAPESVTSVAVAALAGLTRNGLATAGEQGAAPIQMIRATVLHAGPPTEAAFTLHGKPLRTTQLAAGRQVLEFPAPAVEHGRSAAFAMTIAGTTIAQRDVNLTPGVREIIVVFKTHFDIGYTDMASNVVHALSHDDDGPGAGGGGPKPRPAAGAAIRLDHSRLADAQDPGRLAGPDAGAQQRIEQAFKEGRFVVHALPFTTHTELLEAGRPGARAGIFLPACARRSGCRCRATRR